MHIGTTRQPITVILLSLVTCGIYLWYWLYVTTQDINNALGEERINTVMMLVLSILCAPVLFYWLYQIDKALVDISAKDGVAYSESFIIWLILSLVAGVGSIIAEFQIQTAMNNIWAARSAMTPPSNDQNFSNPL